MKNAYNLYQLNAPSTHAAAYLQFETTNRFPESRRDESLEPAKRSSPGPRIAICLGTSLKDWITSSNRENSGNTNYFFRYGRMEHGSDEKRYFPYGWLENKSVT